MNTICFIKTHVTSSGCVHAQVKINNVDVGLLYLSPEEINILTDALRHGLVGSNTTLETDLVSDDYCEENY